MTAFSSLPIAAPLLKAIDVLGFSDMTPVQEHALPALLAGKDVIGQARTGSGKTVAFGLALLSHVDVTLTSSQALVLCPTRELADQVTAEVRRLARFVSNLRVVTLCGGVPKRAQTASLARSPHVVVGTPGRILDHLGQGNLDLSALRVFVLDEADRMLDMGFGEDIADIAGETPDDRQTLLFSATFPKVIRKMSRVYQRAAVEVTVDTEAAAGEIEQTFYECESGEKTEALAALLGQHRPESALVFCQTRADAREVAQRLRKKGFSALALHGELEQHERDDVMLRFANKSCTVLVATDVAARGLDVEGLAAVVSYELPNDPDIHVHRIGRTGRAGRKGIALSLCAPRERHRVEGIEERAGHRVTWGELRHDAASKRPPQAPMVTLIVRGGRQDKLRKGDLLGALTGDVGLPGDSIGKIDVLQRRTYVAVKRGIADKALAGLQANQIKRRKFRVSRVD